MANRTKTALNSDVKLKSLEKSFEAQAESQGLLNDYLFVQHYRAYKDQLQIMDRLKEKVDELGIMVTVPVGRDGEKEVVNPAISEYNRMAGLANKTASAILGLIQSQARPDDEEECEL